MLFTYFISNLYQLNEYYTIKKCIDLEYIIINPETSYWNNSNIHKIHNTINKLLFNIVHCNINIRTIQLENRLLELLSCTEVPTKYLLELQKITNNKLVVLLVNNIPKKKGCYYDEGLIIIGWNSGYLSTKDLDETQLRSETLVHEILHSGQLQHIKCKNNNDKKYHPNLMFTNDDKCFRDRYRTEITPKQKDKFLSNSKFVYSCR